jgi:hypothetical protein
MGARLNFSEIPANLRRVHGASNIAISQDWYLSLIDHSSTTTSVHTCTRATSYDFVSTRRRRWLLLRGGCLLSPEINERSSTSKRDSYYQPNQLRWPSSSSYSVSRREYMAESCNAQCSTFVEKNADSMVKISFESKDSTRVASSPRHHHAIATNSYHQMTNCRYIQNCQCWQSCIEYSSTTLTISTIEDSPTYLRLRLNHLWRG